MQDVIAEAGPTVEQLREQLRASELRCGESFEFGQFINGVSYLGCPNC